MKSCCSFLLLFFFALTSMPQNLIADWSAEDVYQCPNSLGFVELFLNDWTSLRGSPDYFHSCCELPQLCWNNSLGYQQPQTGEGYMGAVTYFGNLPGTREYLGVQLLEPLEIGESYFISFHASMAYSYLPIGASKMGSNNLGFLLMTSNYLDSEEQGVTPNFSHYRMDTLHTDTTNWVEVSTVLVADSAYSLIAFGNFYDDENTEAVAPFNEKPIYGYAYYYFDDFCVSKDANSCDEVLSVKERDKPLINVYPNPTQGNVHFQSSSPVNRLLVMDLSGRVVKQTDQLLQFEGVLNLTDYPSGMYFIQFQTEAGASTKRVVVQ